MTYQDMSGGDASTRRLVLWRHGRTEWNLKGIAQGHADVPLDAVGRAQARRAAPFIASYRPAFIWSSDLARARETAEELAELCGIEVGFDRRLREFDVGVRQGMTFAEFCKTYPEMYARWIGGDENAAVAGAETADEVNERLVAVLNDAVASLAAGETGVLVSHGACLRSGLIAFFGVPQRLRFMLAGMSNCAWAVLEEDPTRGWRIIDYNAQTLPEPLALADDI